MTRTDSDHLGAELGWSTHLVYGSLRWFAMLLARLWWRFRVVDEHHLPKQGAVIVSPVHRSNIDVPMLGISARRRLRYLAKGSLFKNRFWTWFLTMSGAFPLKREVAADRDALRASLAILERGEALAVFPEGERKAGPRVYPMLDGAAWLSVKTGAPIMPVGIGGTAESMPKGSLMPRPTRIVYLYGALVYPPEPLPGAKRVGREQMSEHSARLRETIQDLYDTAQRAAGHEPPPDTHSMLIDGLET